MDYIKKFYDFAQDIHSRHGIDVEEEIRRTLADSETTLKCGVTSVDGSFGHTFDTLDELKRWQNERDEPQEVNMSMEDFKTMVDEYEAKDEAVKRAKELHQRAQDGINRQKTELSFGRKHPPRRETPIPESKASQPSSEDKVLREIHQMYEKLNVMSWKSLLVGTGISIVVTIVTNPSIMHAIVNFLKR